MLLNATCLSAWEFSISFAAGTRENAVFGVAGSLRSFATKEDTDL